MSSQLFNYLIYPFITILAFAYVVLNVFQGYVTAKYNRYYILLTSLVVGSIWALLVKSISNNNFWIILFFAIGHSLGMAFMSNRKFAIGKK